MQITNCYSILSVNNSYGQEENNFFFFWCHKVKVITHVEDVNFSMGRFLTQRAPMKAKKKTYET